MKRGVTAVLLLGALLFGGGAPAQAPPPGPSVVRGQRDLRFQTVIPGLPTSVDWSSNQAGQWLLRGQRGAEIQLDFINLPSSLQSGGNNLPVSFSVTDAAWRTPGGGNASTAFDPNTGATVRFSSRSNLMWIYLGGTANPTSGQAGGDYFADVDLDVYYTGN